VWALDQPDPCLSYLGKPFGSVVGTIVDGRVYEFSEGTFAREDVESVRLWVSYFPFWLIEEGSNELFMVNLGFTSDEEPILVPFVGRRVRASGCISPGAEVIVQDLRHIEPLD
jgi:hypothetical protein